MLFKIGNASVNWFDVVVLATIVFGFIRGRKHGMSEELLPLLQWICILLGCAFGYKRLGMFTSQLSGVEINLSYLLSCLVIAGVAKWIFTVIRHSVGDKLIGTDVFGVTEYYLGMVAGVVRCLCVLIFCLSLMNSVYVSEADIAATRKMQQANFGDITFPTFGTIQIEVLHSSFCGPLVKKHLKLLLIEPERAPAGNKLKDRQRQRQKELDAVTDGK